MSTIVKELSRCSAKDIDGFVALVNAAGQVTSGLRKRVIANSHRLAFHYTEGGQLVAVAALKRPNPLYRKRVFQKAQADQNPDDYPLEFGWMAVSPVAQGQGLSRILAEAILSYALDENVYATTEEANERMRRTNAKIGFNVSGQPFLDDEGKDRLLLFIRPSLHS